VSRADLLDIVQTLTAMERETWTEIRAKITGNGRRGALNKFISMEDLCKDAQDRLNDLKLDEFSDNFFRFKLGNMKRLWGVVYDDIFFPVWWDRDHEVCPSEER
jgi:hypothetical protein